MERRMRQTARTADSRPGRRSRGRRQWVLAEAERAPQLWHRLLRHCTFSSWDGRENTAALKHPHEAERPSCCFLRFSEMLRPDSTADQPLINKLEMLLAAEILTGIPSLPQWKLWLYVLTKILLACVFLSHHRLAVWTDWLLLWLKWQADWILRNTNWDTTSRFVSHVEVSACRRDFAVYIFIQTAAHLWAEKTRRNN